MHPQLPQWGRIHSRLGHRAPACTQACAWVKVKRDSLQITSNHTRNTIITRNTAGIRGCVSSQKMFLSLYVCFYSCVWGRGKLKIHIYFIGAKQTFTKQFPKLFSLQNICIMFVFVYCVCACAFICVSACFCHRVLVIRGQLLGVGSLLLMCGSWGLNQGLQAWQQAPLFSEPFHQPQTFFFFFLVFIPCLSIGHIFLFFYYTL